MTTHPTDWSPWHPTTEHAWHTVHASIAERQARGLWSSRSVAVSIAAATGITHTRATDLITSAIRHGHLEERPNPLDQHGHHKHPTHVRLTTLGRSSQPPTHQSVPSPSQVRP